MSNVNSLVTLAARVLLSILFIWSGFGKLSDVAGAAGYMSAMGVPALLVWPTIALELLGGLAILFGFQTRVVAVLLAGFSILTAMVAHLHPADLGQMINFYKNLGLTGGFLLLAVHGAGAYAVDAIAGRRSAAA